MSRRCPRSTRVSAPVLVQHQGPLLRLPTLTGAPDGWAPGPSCPSVVRWTELNTGESGRREAGSGGENRTTPARTGAEGCGLVSKVRRRGEAVSARGGHGGRGRGHPGARGDQGAAASDAAELQQALGAAKARSAELEQQVAARAGLNILWVWFPRLIRGKISRYTGVSRLV
jgi:hypothetical protein